MKAGRPAGVDSKTNEQQFCASEVSAFALEASQIYSVTTRGEGGPTDPREKPTCDVPYLHGPRLSKSSQRPKGAVKGTDAPPTVPQCSSTAPLPLLVPRRHPGGGGPPPAKTITITAAGPDKAPRRFLCRASAKPCVHVRFSGWQRWASRRTSPSCVVFEPL